MCLTLMDGTCGGTSVGLRPCLFTLLIANDRQRCDDVRIGVGTQASAYALL